MVEEESNPNSETTTSKQGSYLTKPPLGETEVTINDTVATSTAKRVEPLNPEVVNSDVSDKPEEPAAEDEVVEKDDATQLKQSLVKTVDKYEASDSLPDMSQKMTTEITDNMDTPRIYDTKEYIVPIHDTVHSHGTIGKIVAGFISALIVLAIVIALAYLVI